jgi:adenosylmethionine-8-amino-7-oxononanoate aminotransferase
MPPLAISTEQVDELVDVLQTVILEVEQTL